MDKGINYDGQIFPPSGFLTLSQTSIRNFLLSLSPKIYRLFIFIVKSSYVQRGSEYMGSLQIYMENVFENNIKESE